MKNGLFFTSLCSLGVASSAWTIPSSSTSTSTSTSSSRRNFLDQATKVVPLVIVGAPLVAVAEDEIVVAPPAQSEASAAPVVESSAAAEAPAVVPAFVEEEPAPLPAPVEENQFIARLKAQSEANREKNKALAERSDKLSFSHFQDNYDRPSYVGVYHRDTGKVTMVLKDEFQGMMANGQVVKTYQSKVSKKTGEISDDYAQPIYVYAN